MTVGRIFTKKYISLYIYLGLFFYKNRKNSGITPGLNDDPVTRWPGRERWPKWPTDPVTQWPSCMSDGGNTPVGVYLESVAGRHVVHSGAQSAELGPQRQRQSVLVAAWDGSDARVRRVLDGDVLSAAVQQSAVADDCRQRDGVAVRAYSQQRVRDQLPLVDPVHVNHVVTRSTFTTSQSPQRDYKER